MPTPQYAPTVPMPETTKRATKRKKIRYKGQAIRNTSVASQIYRMGTDCIVADEATEKRLGRLGSCQLKEDSFIW